MIYAVTTAAVLLILFAVFQIFLPWGVRNFFRRRFLERIRVSGGVCLTFDDGPNPEATPRIQALLDQAGIKATFFVTGEHAEQYPELIHNLLASGHEIGEHSYSHRHPWHADPVHSWRDIVRTQQVLKRILGSDGACYFRPPFGKLNWVTLLYVLIRRRPLAFWNVSPRDFQQPSAQAIVDLILADLGPGRVILLHDGRYQTDLNNSADLTVQAVEILLKEFAQRDIHPVTLRQALGKP